jgi:molybdopterin synthase catalytic subunit
MLVRLFAILRERRGVETLDVDPLPGETAQQLYARLFPDLAGVPVMYAIDRAYADPSAALAGANEIAFIPPIGGGDGDLTQLVEAGPRVLLTDAPLDLAPALALVRSPERGGICIFAGTARDTFEGRPVLRLEYEAFPEMAVAEMERLCDALEVRFPGTKLAMGHRVGALTPGEAAVYVIAASPQRADAFAACRAGIDELKERVPIWKKEVYKDGAAWKANGPG